MAVDELARHTHQYLRDYITHAEGKAGVVATASVGALAFLEAKGALEFSVMRWGHVGDWAGLLAAIAFAAAGMLALAVVWPRLGVRKGSGSKDDQTTKRMAGDPGVIFWDEIRTDATPDAYATRVSKLSSEGAQRELTEHSWVLAGINQSKYRFVNYALRTLVGAVALLCTHLFLREDKPAASTSPAPTVAPAAMPMPMPMPAPVPPPPTAPAGAPAPARTPAASSPPATAPTAGTATPLPSPLPPPGKSQPTPPAAPQPP